MPGVSSLHGTVKYYDWGGTSFIPALLRINNNEQRPFAEYWMGVHPQAACTIDTEAGERLLKDYVKDDSLQLLGGYVSRKFGNVPYLVKALDVRDMLSIQVHPTKESAAIEYAKENAAGIPPDAPTRNYKDANHKPELMVAIDDFWLLHGFRNQDDLVELLSAIPELYFLVPILQSRGYKELYRTVMEMPQDEVNHHLQPLLDRLTPLYDSGKLEKSDPHYWAVKGSLTFSKPGQIDRGIFSVYLFNLLHLRKGEAIFQDAGIPHAYLFGQNVEIMASSDNVLRGGLTTKHIDVKELLKHTKCEATDYSILKGELKDGERIYKTPAPDFELSSFSIAAGKSVTHTATTAEIILLIEGEVDITVEKKTVTVQAGNPAAVLFAGSGATFTARSQALLFKATVPVAPEEMR